MNGHLVTNPKQKAKEARCSTVNSSLYTVFTDTDRHIDTAEEFQCKCTMPDSYSQGRLYMDRTEISTKEGQKLLLIMTPYTPAGPDGIYSTI